MSARPEDVIAGALCASWGSGFVGEGDAARVMAALHAAGFVVVRDVGDRVAAVPLRIPTYEDGWNACRRAMLAAATAEGGE